MFAFGMKCMKGDGNDRSVLWTQHHGAPAKKEPFGSFFAGAPWRTRTVDTKRRRLVLYPSELMVHILGSLLATAKQVYHTLPHFASVFFGFAVFLFPRSRHFFAYNNK